RRQSPEGARGSSPHGLRPPCRRSLACWSSRSFRVHPQARRATEIRASPREYTRRACRTPTSPRSRSAASASSARGNGPGGVISQGEALELAALNQDPCADLARPELFAFQQVVDGSDRHVEKCGCFPLSAQDTLVCRFTHFVNSSLDEKYA